MTPSPVGRKRRMSRALWRVTIWPRFAYHYVRSLAGLVLAAVCLLAVPVGCAGSKPLPAIAQPESAARVAYDAARIALSVLDTLEDERLAELERDGYSAGDLAAAEVRVKRLKLAREALEKAHGYLVAGEPPGVRSALRDAVKFLRQLAGDPAVSVPDECLQGLTMVEAWLALGGDGGS